jgi:hypothetical protein
MDTIFINTNDSMDTLLSIIKLIKYLPGINCWFVLMFLVSGSPRNHK